MSYIVERVNRARKNIEIAKDIIEENKKSMDSGIFMKEQEQRISVEGVQKEFKSIIIENSN